MSDFIDETLVREDAILAAKIKSIRANANKRTIKPREECLYCEEPFNKGSKKVFCDADCAADHIKYTR
jgi:hypothetical protein